LPIDEVELDFVFQFFVFCAQPAMPLVEDFSMLADVIDQPLERIPPLDQLAPLRVRVMGLGIRTA
jgi:hypothetical protein